MSYAFRLNSLDTLLVKDLCRLHAFYSWAKYALAIFNDLQTRLSFVEFSLRLSLYESQVIPNAIACKLFTTACPTENMFVQNGLQYFSLPLQFTLNVLRMFRMNANLYMTIKLYHYILHTNVCLV